MDRHPPADTRSMLSVELPTSPKRAAHLLPRAGGGSIQSPQQGLFPDYANGTRGTSAQKEFDMAAMATTNRGDINFALSGFANRMGWGKRPVLLVIDVCKAYWAPESPLNLTAHEPSAAVPEVIRRLVNVARNSKTPIIWTAVEYNDMREAGLFWLKSKSLDAWHVHDSRGFHKWMEGLEPLGERELVIRKKYASAFFGTTLATDLALLGADTVVLCGVSTSGCVRASALDAMQNGFRPMVVGPACGDRSEEIQSANLFDLNAKYADVVTEADAIDHLTRKWE